MCMYEGGMTLRLHISARVKGYGRNRSAFADIAQRLEHLPYMQVVEGSNPSVGTISRKSTALRWITNTAKLSGDVEKHVAQRT